MDKKEDVEGNILELIKIDKFKLDEEALKQPELLISCINIYIKKMENYERRKLDLQEISIDTISRIKKRPDKYKIHDGKFTADILESAKALDSEYSDAATALTEAKTEAEKWKLIVDLVKSRKGSIETLYDMWKIKYFS